MTRATVIVRRVSRRLSEPVVMPVEPDLSEYLTINQVCEWLGITGNTLLAWRRNHAFPTIEIDGYVRFRRDAVRQWLAERECGTVPTPLRRSA